MDKFIRSISNLEKDHKDFKKQINNQFDLIERDLDKSSYE